MASSHRGDRGDIQMPCKLHVFLPGGSEIHMGIKMIKHDVYVYVYIYVDIDRHCITTILLGV
jgi:hypothetical protein